MVTGHGSGRCKPVRNSSRPRGLPLGKAFLPLAGGCPGGSHGTLRPPERLHSSGVSRCQGWAMEDCAQSRGA